LDNGMDIDFIPGIENADVHSLASLMKLWFRELPEVIPVSFYDAFIEANKIEGYDERLYAIRDLVWQLPKPSFDLLKRLCEHLHLITEHELENQMHASNLAIVYAPTLLKPPESKESFGILMSNLGKAVKITASLITQQNWIFSYEIEVEDEAEPENEGEAEIDDNSKYFTDTAISPRNSHIPSLQETITDIVEIQAQPNLDRTKDDKNEESSKTSSSTYTQPRRQPM